MTDRARARAGVVAALVAVTVVSGCAGSSPEPAPGHSRGTSYAPITVFAAASLRTVFDEVAVDVEHRTGAEVRVQYAGSAELASQLGAGGPGDVFASADEAQMAAAVANGSVDRGASRVFATNTPTVITLKGNPRRIVSMAGLADPSVSTVVCAPQVPCGAAARRLFAAAGVVVRPVSEETQVTDVLGKVGSGQADAGVVYVTDARAAHDRVDLVPTPEAGSVRNRYPIAVTRYGRADPGRAATATAFVDDVLGGTGPARLAHAGFGVPAAGRGR